MRLDSSAMDQSSEPLTKQRNTSPMGSVHLAGRAFAPMMQPDGLMFAGHSESFLHAADLFKSQGKTVYALARAR